MILDPCRSLQPIPVRLPFSRFMFVLPQSERIRILKVLRSSKHCKYSEEVLSMPRSSARGARPRMIREPESAPPHTPHPSGSYLLRGTYSTPRRRSHLAKLSLLLLSPFLCPGGGQKTKKQKTPSLFAESRNRTTPEVSFGHPRKVWL